jgi:alpha-L-rhamnosidase
MKKFKGKFLTVPCDGGGGRGYLSRSFKEGEPFELWAQIDLGGEERFDRIVLYPTRCPELGDIVGTGYGFPVRFKIEGSDDEAFNNKSTLLYETSEDIPNPGKEPYEIVLPEAASARFVRLTVIKPYVFPESDGKPTASSNFFSLDEIMIFRGEENLALHKKVKAPNVTTPIEVSAYDWHQVWAYDWHPDCLTDGIAHIREVRRDRGSGNLLRGVFRIGKPVKRALAHIASKGWYELYINGHRVGDAVLDSGRTQFDKRLLYSTLDARELLKEGENTVVIMQFN